MKNYQYQNFSPLLFQGFYESSLYNSDSLYDITYNEKSEGYIADDEEYDFTENGYKEFELDVCKQASYLLLDNLEVGQDIIKGIDLQSISSPRYYNFETDRLNLLVNFDMRKLKKYCWNTNSIEFNKYLNKFWSSRDGFCSFVPNTLEKLKNEYKNGDSIERDRCINVMIEFFLLCNINNTTNCDSFDYDNSYQWQLIEYADSCLWNYITPTKIS